VSDLEIALAIYWRISNYIDLSGEGGRIEAARWHSQGSRVVYLAESPSAAMLEMIVHMEFDIDDLPDEFTLLEIAIPDGLGIHPIDPSSHAEWRHMPELTRQLGSDWLASQETPLARVPSAIAPRTWNFLLNPEHPDAARASIAEVIRERFDNRLFRFGTR
jgi:RES domain-containing protein